MAATMWRDFFFFFLNLEDSLLDSDHLWGSVRGSFIVEWSYSQNWPDVMVLYNMETKPRHTVQTHSFVPKTWMSITSILLRQCHCLDWWRHFWVATTVYSDISFNWMVSWNGNLLFSRVLAKTPPKKQQMHSTKHEYLCFDIKKQHIFKRI